MNLEAQEALNKRSYQGWYDKSRGMAFREDYEKMHPIEQYYYEFGRIVAAMKISLDMKDEVRDAAYSYGIKAEERMPFIGI